MEPSTAPADGATIFETITGTITYNSATGAQWDGVNPIYVQSGDSIQINFSGFPAGSNLQQVTFTSAVWPILVLTWTPDSGSTLDGNFSITMGEDDLDSAMEIADWFTGKAWYYLTAYGFVGGGGTWKIDPEVINGVLRPGPGKE